jgi:hypothetical protein
MYLSNDVMGVGKCPWGDGELAEWPIDQFASKPSPQGHFPLLITSFDKYI